MSSFLTSKTLQVILVIICVVGTGFGIRACTMTCPTVTGKREEPGFFGNYYLDLSDNTTVTVSAKVYNTNDIGDHHC